MTLSISLPLRARPSIKRCLVDIFTCNMEELFVVMDWNLDNGESYIRTLNLEPRRGVQVIRGLMGLHQGKAKQFRTENQVEC